MVKGIKISKKLVVASVSAVIILLSDLLNIKIDDATLQNIAIIVATYLVSQGGVDIFKEKANGKMKDDLLRTTLLKIIKENVKK